VTITRGNNLVLWKFEKGKRSSVTTQWSSSKRSGWTSSNGARWDTSSVPNRRAWTRGNRTTESIAGDVMAITKSRFLRP